MFGVGISHKRLRERSFTLAMLFGVVFGTYSSIFVAAPLLILFRLRPGTSNADDKENTALSPATQPSST